MKLIAVSVEVNDKQYNAMTELSKLRGYETLEEELSDDIKNTGRRAIENLKDELEESNYRTSKQDSDKQLIASINLLRDAIERAR